MPSMRSNAVMAILAPAVCVAMPVAIQENQVDAAASHEPALGIPHAPTYPHRFSCMAPGAMYKDPHCEHSRHIKDFGNGQKNETLGFVSVEITDKKGAEDKMKENKGNGIGNDEFTVDTSSGTGLDREQLEALTKDPTFVVPPDLKKGHLVATTIHDQK